MEDRIIEKHLFLTYTDMTTAETGYRLHFENPAYFGRFFKREINHSPTDFRQHIREKYQFFRE